MKIAFYAPMKHPDSNVPSGDREMARNLIRALQQNHTVSVASRFCSRDGAGNPRRQQRLAELGAKCAARLVRRWTATGDVPDAWLTYHVYHKAPDFLGPAVTKAFDIPYFMAEASHAPKQSGGNWDIGYRAAEAAIRAADGIIGLSSLDAACVMPLLDNPDRYHRLAPFTETALLAQSGANRVQHRTKLRARHAIDADTPILLAVGMMRDGDKLASYRVLADAMRRVTDRLWTLVIVGDGPARRETKAAFAVVPPDRIIYAGAVAPGDLPALYAAADLMVWPAINEAYGMAMLEAQAAGLPVIAGRTGGVPDVVRDGRTGVLCPVGDAVAFADAVSDLLASPSRRDAMRKVALSVTAAEHDTAIAARRLNEILHSNSKARAA
jgi:glycosyltransferase involved in cell wall biosynthesis